MHIGELRFSVSGDELVRMGKEADMAYFKVLYRNLLRVTEENHLYVT
jgi:hypothetical protein